MEKKQLKKEFFKKEFSKFSFIKIETQTFIFAVEILILNLCIFFIIKDKKKCISIKEEVFKRFTYIICKSFIYNSEKSILKRTSRAGGPFYSQFSYIFYFTL